MVDEINKSYIINPLTKERDPMPRGVNKVMLIGNLGADPELRSTKNNNAVANVTIATSNRWRNKTTNEIEESTEWHRIVFFNKLAEIVGEYLKKGSKIYVEGRLQTRKWTDDQGRDCYTTEIIANEMQSLSPFNKDGAYPEPNGNVAPAQEEDFDDVPF